MVMVGSSPDATAPGRLDRSEPPLERQRQVTDQVTSVRARLDGILGRVENLAWNPVGGKELPAVFATIGSVSGEVLCPHPALPARAACRDLHRDAVEDDLLGRLDEDGKS